MTAKEKKNTKSASARIQKSFQLFNIVFDSRLDSFVRSYFVISFRLERKP